jgi:Cupin-like domain/PilZ domain
MIELPYQGEPVSALHNPTRDEFLQRVARADVPFKVTGAIDHWMLVRTLGMLANPIDQLDYLSCLLKKSVRFTVLPPEKTGALRLGDDLKPNFSFRSKKAPFAVFADEVKAYLFDPNRGTLYLQSQPIESFAAQLGALDLFEGFEPLSAPRFWIGSGRQKLGLHNDPFSNIIAVFAGRKRLILAPPEELPNLYPAPFDRRLGNVFCSLVDVYSPDFEKFSRFRSAAKSIRIAVLEPGEFLYMPPLWWHAVESDTFNVGINCWFFDDGPRMRLSHHCYFPGRNLLDVLSKTTENERKNLRDLFSRAFDTDGVWPETKDGTPARKVIRTAKNLKETIDGSDITQEQKNLWRGWVRVFCDWYIFCVNDNPYPTLGTDEHQRMVQRIGRPTAIAQRSVGAAAYSVFHRYRTLKKMLNPTDHHQIVPSKCKDRFRVETGKPVAVHLNGQGVTAVLADASIGGLFIRGMKPPPVGSLVTVCMRNPGHDDVTVQAVVVWQRQGEGYGAKFSDQNNRVSQFVQALQRASASNQR